MKVILAISIYAALAFSEKYSHEILTDSAKTSDHMRLKSMRDDDPSLLEQPAGPTWMRPSAINPAATCSTSNADVERPSGDDASQTTCWRTFDGSDNTVFHTSGGAHNPELGVNSRRTHGSSGWTNRPDLGPPTLTYDFGGNVQISGFRQYAYRASFAAAECLRDFTLYTCTDSACTTRTSIGSFSHAGTSQTFAEDQTSTFTSVSTRYLMVELTGNHGDTAWGGRVNIAEVEFLSQVPGGR